jgi:hypothetical protein
MPCEMKIAKHKKSMKTNHRYNSRFTWFSLGQSRCHCCGVQLNWAPHHKNSATFEHLVPKSHGGTYNARNGIIVCARCNETRGNTDWIDWVIMNQFPKKEWLIGKYIDAVEFYYNHAPLNDGLKKKYVEYIRSALVHQ